MAGVRHAVAYIRGDTQFLIELTPQGFFRAFAVLYLTPGKLPFKGHGLVRPPLTDQDLLLSQDKCGHDQPNYLCAGS